MAAFYHPASPKPGVALTLAETAAYYGSFCADPWQILKAELSLSV